MQQKKLTQPAKSPHQTRFFRMRLLRFVLWAVAMCVTGSIVGWYYPHKAIFVPSFFLAIMVPAVLLPTKPKEESPS